MDGQIIGALSAVALAGAYVVWQGWRTWRGMKAGCGGGCGCAKSSKTQTNVAIIAPESLVLRRKNGGSST